MTETAKIRLYVKNRLRRDETVCLDREQSHYLTRVMRRGVGDSVAVFNAMDGEWLGMLTDATKSGVTVRLAEQTRVPVRETPFTLFIAPVKRAAMDLVIRQATELGVGAFVPVITDFSNVGRLREERLQAIAIEAAEQCGRISVPELAPLQPLDTALQNWPGAPLVWCDESGAAPAVMAALATLTASPEGVLIGPEGGFSPEERDRLRSHEAVCPVDLGATVLRVDTAVVSALSIVGQFRRSV